MSQIGQLFGILTRQSGGQLPGTATNDNASAGNLGEYIEQDVPSGSAVALTTLVSAEAAFINLTAGDWDVWGTVVYTGNAATVFSFGWANVHTSIAVPLREFAFLVQGTTGVFPAMFAPMRRFSLSITTRISLVASASFSTNTCSAYGTISGRRAR